MVSELDGKASVSVLYIAKDAAAVAALSEFFEGHMEFMKAKRETEGCSYENADYSRGYYAGLADGAAACRRDKQ